jgi:hypothetical protein
MGILSFVITVLILLEHLQTNPLKMTLTSAYLSTELDFLKDWGYFSTFLVKLYNCFLYIL